MQKSTAVFSTTSKLYCYLAYLIKLVTFDMGPRTVKGPEVLRWTRARSECLPEGPKITVTPLLAFYMSKGFLSENSTRFSSTSWLSFSNVSVVATQAATWAENQILADNEHNYVNHATAART